MSMSELDQLAKPRRFAIPIFFGAASALLYAWATADRDLEARKAEARKEMFTFLASEASASDQYMEREDMQRTAERHARYMTYEKKPLTKGMHYLQQSFPAVFPAKPEPASAKTVSRKEYRRRLKRAKEVAKAHNVDHNSDGKRKWYDSGKSFKAPLRTLATQCAMNQNLIRFMETHRVANAVSRRDMKKLSKVMQQQRLREMFEVWKVDPPAPDAYALYYLSVQSESKTADNQKSDTVTIESDAVAVSEEQGAPNAGDVMSGDVSNDQSERTSEEQS